MKALDIVNHKYGRLTVIRRLGSKKRLVYWECKCICGNTIEVSTGNLRSGNTTSCGCKRKDTIKEVCTTHGMVKSNEYQIWAGMKARCSYKKHTVYKRYGGAGIRVCKRWNESFENFYADMGPRPSLKHSIDRIDSTGMYEPGNCRWATPTEQIRNRSNTRHLVYIGVRMTLAEFAECHRLDYDKVKYRLNLGKTPEEIINELGKTKYL